MLKTVITIACACVLLTTAGQAGDPQTLKGNAAFGDWHDDKPGVKRLLTLKDLPPVSTPTYAAAAIAPMPAGARPLVPEGFSAEMVASGLPNPRAMHIAPNGDLFVAESLSNAVRVYRIPAGTATPTNSEVYAGGLSQPFGIAFYPPGPNPEWIYIANSDSVVRFRYTNGDLKAAGKPENIVDGIPWTHHYARDIATTAEIDATGEAKQ